MSKTKPRYNYRDVDNRSHKRQYKQSTYDRAVTEAIERARQLGMGQEIPDRKRTVPKSGRTMVQQMTDTYAAAQLSALGYTTEEIAKVLGISKAMVYNDMAKIKEVFRQRASVDIEAARGEHIMITEQAVKELWREWNNSKREQVETTSEAIKGAPGKDGEQAVRGKIVTKKKTARGDANYLFTMTKVMERQAKLAGLDKPVEARVFIEQAQDMVADIGAMLVEELGETNPELVSKIIEKLEERTAG